MKFFAVVILMALLSFAACLFFPWWSIAPVAFLVILIIPLKPGKAFMAGFTALFLLWAGLSGWISHNNEHVLAIKMTPVILKMVKTPDPYYLITLTGVIGGIVAGMAALTASFIRPVNI